MPFPRSVIYEAQAYLGFVVGSHYDVDDIFLRWELDQFDQRREGGIRGRFRDFFRFLQANPQTAFEGRLLSDLLVEEAASRTNTIIGYPDVTSAFTRALERAGYSIVDGQIRRDLPDIVDLPAAEDEVQVLLNRYDLNSTRTNLDQAIDNHTRGQWEAANGQIRVFLESLLDEVAYALVPGVTRVPVEDQARRDALVALDPPFLMLNLFEWGNHGKNLVNGVFKRLNPLGAHPGLSDEEDSTFRLHLVLLLGRLFLRRFDARRGGRP
jgi:hypothetical protein